MSEVELKVTIPITYYEVTIPKVEWTKDLEKVLDQMVEFAWQRAAIELAAKKAMNIDTIEVEELE